MVYVNSEPGNGSCDDGLSPAQTLGVIKVVEAKVQESENRVLRAIDDLGRRMARMDDRFERMDQRLGTLATEVSDVKIDLARMEGRLTWKLLGGLVLILGIFEWISRFPS